MTNYGILFKQFREAKGYSIREVSEDIVSYQFLNNFEKGNSNISLSNFVKILERINLTYEEFFVAHDETLESVMENAIEDVRVVGTAWNALTAQQLIKKYRKLYLETDWIVYHHFAITIEMISIMGRGNQQEVSAEYFQSMKHEMKNYLFNIETWTEYERTLFNILNFLFTKDEIVSVMNRLIRNLKTGSNKLRMVDGKSVEEIIQNAIFELLRKSAVKEAEDLLTKMKATIKFESTVANIPNIVNMQYIEGLVKFRSNDDSGLFDICNSLNVLVLLKGYEPIANALYNTYLMHQELMQQNDSIIHKKIMPGSTLFTIELMTD